MYVRPVLPHLLGYARLHPCICDLGKQCEPQATVDPRRRATTRGLVSSVRSVRDSADCRPRPRATTRGKLAQATVDPRRRATTRVSTPHPLLSRPYNDYAPRWGGCLTLVVILSCHNPRYALHLSHSTALEGQRHGKGNEATMTEHETILRDYLREIESYYKLGISKEHSYRAALQGLLPRLVPGITPVNEPKRVACGAPDYVV